MIKNYTPELPDELKQNASVSLGDFSYNCEICRNSENVTVTVLDTNAKGMVMMYNGNDLSFVYEDYSYSVNAENLEKTNVAIVIYQVFEALLCNDTASKKIENGYQYRGEIDLGEFVLIQNDDNTFKSITVIGPQMKIIFE